MSFTKVELGQEILRIRIVRAREVLYFRASSLEGGAQRFVTDVQVVGSLDLKVKYDFHPMCSCYDSELGRRKYQPPLRKPGRNGSDFLTVTDRSV